MALVSALSIVQVFENQRNNYWDFFITDNPTMKFRIKTCSLPLPKLEVTTRSSWDSFYTGRTITHTITLEIYEDIAFSTFAYFQAWQDLVYNRFTKKFNSYPRGFNPTRKIGIFQFYPATSALIDMPPNKVFTLTGLKILSLADLSSNYEEGGPLTYSVTLSFDDILMI